MNQDHYNAVREAVVKAVPEIMELKFGCEVLVGDTRVRAISTEGRVLFICPTINGLNTEFIEDVIVLGRPIRLADVLLATKNHYVSVDSPGVLFIEGEFEAGPRAEWNLRNDDLSQQSPELIDFLYTLLVGGEK